MISKLEKLNQKLINDIDLLNKLLNTQYETIEYQLEMIEMLEKQKLKAQSENRALKLEILNLNENQELINNMRDEINELQKCNKREMTNESHSKNTRGAGRKKSITDDQIKEIQEMRVQGMKLQEIQNKTGISYGNIQKYSKLIVDNKKAGL